jgi:hypothetical protein
MERAGPVTHMEELRNAHRIIVRKPEGKRLLARCRNRQDDNIKMDIKHIGCEYVE